MTKPYSMEIKWNIIYWDRLNNRLNNISRANQFLEPAGNNIILERERERGKKK